MDKLFWNIFTFTGGPYYPRFLLIEVYCFDYKIHYLLSSVLVFEGYSQDVHPANNNRGPIFRLETSMERARSQLGTNFTFFPYTSCLGSCFLFYKYVSAIIILNNTFEMDKIFLTILASTGGPYYPRFFLLIEVYCFDYKIHYRRIVALLRQKKP